MGKVNSKLLLKTSKKFDNQPYSSYPSSFPPSPSSPSSLSSLSSSSLSSSLSSLSSKSSPTSPISKSSSPLPSNLSNKFSRLRSKSFTNLQSFNCTPTPPIPLPFSSTFFSSSSSSSSSPSSHQKSFSSPIVLPTKNSSEECLLIPSAPFILTPSSFKKKSKKSKLFSSISTNSIEKSSSLSPSPSSPSSEISDMYQYVDNRKYFKTDDESQNIRYVFPLDNDEIDRLQTQHFIQKHVWGGNFSAPIESILSNENSKILDVGCGTGVWTLDMASEFTKPKFFGVDIEPLYPAEIKPENVQFVNANVLTGLPFEDNTFDFVYMRFMLFAFTIADWERAVSELIRVTKVGGFIEIMENDIQWYNENPFCNSVRTTIVEGLKNQRNMELIISPILPKILAKSMAAAGETNFVNNTSSSSAALRRRRRREVNYEERLVPFGGGKVGGLYKDLYSWSAKNLKKAMSEIGFKESEWNATVDTCLKQLEDSKAFDKIHRFWVMKQ